MTKLFDYSEVKSQMIAVRYRDEQNITRLAGIAACKDKNLVVECYAGAGGLTEVYKKYFKEVTNNDINEESVALHNFTALDFIKKIVARLNRKIDMIDFDCYGSPAFEIQEFFKHASKHAPFVIALSDGFGLNLKFSKKEAPIRSRYLITGELNTNKIWLRLDCLIDNLLTTLAKEHGLLCHKICGVQTKNKNYVLAAYVVDNYCKVVDNSLNSGKKEELVMVESKIESEILELVKVRTHRDDTRQDYLDRLMRAVTKLKDPEWEILSTAAQDWTNAAAQSAKDGTDIVDFPDLATEEVAEEITDQVQTKRGRGQAKNNGARKESACHTIKKFVVKQPTITVAELSEKLKSDGFKVSDVTIATLRSDIRDTLRVLNELNITDVLL